MVRFCTFDFKQNKAEFVIFFMNIFVLQKKKLITPYETAWLRGFIQKCD